MEKEESTFTTRNFPLVKMRARKGTKAFEKDQHRNALKDHAKKGTRDGVKTLDKIKEKEKELKEHAKNTTREYRRHQMYEHHV